MDTKQILDYYINIGKNNTKKYKIALVANVRGKTKNYVDFDSSSVINEYFSCKRSIGGTLVDLPIFLDN